ncbi:MAG TPA: hypothetical protein VMF03_08450 [Steroidobacteraceae bacterium]|nr:hypothetical protein [Steroidobacteraceae bacterium]
MNRVLAGIAVTATLSLAGLSAHAGCLNHASRQQPYVPFVLKDGPRGPFGGHNAAENIVGTWDVVYTTDPSSAVTAEAFIQWHSDGTEWENINYPILGGNICLGSWKAVDRFHVSRNHVGWLYDGTAGNLIGYFNETETDEVAQDGNSYTGTNTTTLTFYPVPPSTTPTVQVVTGTATAKRIAP